MYFISIIIALATGASIFFIFKFLSGRNTASSTVEQDKLGKEIEKAGDELAELLKYVESYGSKGQYKTLSSKIKECSSALEKEKDGLKGLETKLSSAQEQVEGKEAAQQEIKTAKEEDEAKVEELLANYDDISSESLSLEQKLAESMKNLDQIMDEIELTQDQRGLFEQLAEALSAAGKNLRDLLTEYATINERLQLLQEQHLDLEDEYTKLVEQQLGE